MHDRVICGDLVVDQREDLPFVDHVPSVVEELLRRSDRAVDEPIEDLHPRAGGKPRLEIPAERPDVFLREYWERFQPLPELRGKENLWLLKTSIVVAVRARTQLGRRLVLEDVQKVQQ